MSKYVIFDVDGTLNQTTLYAVDAYKKALKKRGRQAKKEEIISCIGLSPVAICEKLFGKLEEEEIKLWRKDLREYQVELMKENAAPFRGIPEALQILLNEGYKLAICSNAFPEHIEHVLEAIRLQRYFSVIGSLRFGEDKTEVLKVLLEKLDCEKACMVGDRIFDIEAAKYNHIPVIGCAYGYAPKELEGADKIVSCADEIPQAVIELIG